MIVYEYHLFDSKIIKKTYDSKLESIDEKRKCYRLYDETGNYVKTILENEIDNPTNKRTIYYSSECDNTAYEYFRTKLYSNILKSRLAEDLSVSEYTNFLCANGN